MSFLLAAMVLSVYVSCLPVQCDRIIAFLLLCSFLHKYLATCTSIRDRRWTSSVRRLLQCFAAWYLNKSAVFLTSDKRELTEFPTFDTHGRSMRFKKIESVKKIHKKVILAVLDSKDRVRDTLKLIFSS